MNEFLYALGVATWKIGTDAHYKLLKDHFTPKPPELISGLAWECKNCKKHIPTEVRYDQNYCPNCGQRWF